MLIYAHICMGIRKRSGTMLTSYYQWLPTGNRNWADDRGAFTLYFLLFAFFPAAVHPFCTIFVILKTVKINKRKKNENILSLLKKENFDILFCHVTKGH